MKDGGTVHDTVDTISTEIQVDDADLDRMLVALKSSNFAANWIDTSHTEFKSHFSSANEINSKFKLKELLVCLQSIHGKLKRRDVKIKLSDPKYKIVNTFSSLFGDNTEILKKTVKVKSPPSLRSLAKSYLHHACPKSVINAVYAQQIFLSKYEAWNSESPFNNKMKVQNSGDPEFWYAQPEWLSETESFLFNVLDITHLFSNARCTCCSKGMDAAGISKCAWLEVSKREKDNKTGLNLSMVKDLIDRQSNAFARKTFSEKVELEMENLGFKQEAEFCSLIRGWFEAEDEPGLSALERHDRRMRFRKWLLEKYDPFQLPPPGTHVNGIPIVMFEGIMCNIDRRTQLYAVCKQGSYNVRSIGTLDSENFFGEFQSLDPRGSGVVRADDIPSTMETAVELLKARMDENR